MSTFLALVMIVISLPIVFAETKNAYSVGDSVYYGRYPQQMVTDEDLLNTLQKTNFVNDKATIDGVDYYKKVLELFGDAKYFVPKPIEWIILEDSTDSYLLLSKKILDKYAFGNAFWHESQIRSWLNDGFYNTAFSAKDQLDMQTTTVSTFYWPYEDRYVNGKPASSIITEDKVFLLNLDEVTNSSNTSSSVLENSEMRIAYYTQYADKIEQAGRWWVRGPAQWSYGNLQEMFIDATGSQGAYYGTYSYGVRPVIRVSKNASGLNDNPNTEDPVANVYNFGEETYQFENYNKCINGQSCYGAGHCFGMSMTSSGYYNNYLDISILGNKKVLHDYEETASVHAPICYYQPRQGSIARECIVAGGYYHKVGFGKKLLWVLSQQVNIELPMSVIYNISSDWQEIVDYVKDHSFDDKGTLQIDILKEGKGSHAINFLYYKVVDGEDRLYAYDNNYPKEPVYFSMNKDGSVTEKVYSTYEGAIDCICLRSVPLYFSLVDKFDMTHVVYTDIGTLTIDNATAYPMTGGDDLTEHLLYEISDSISTVKITPLEDNATFTYMDKTYSFGEIDEDTYGILTLSETEDGTGSLLIENAPETNPDTPDTPSNPQPENGCKWCGKTHTGFFGGLVGFFHRIFAAIFGARH